MLRPREDHFAEQSGWQVAHRVQTKILVGYELLRIWTDHRKSVVFVTHDIEEAIGLSDRILVMTTGPAGSNRNIASSCPARAIFAVSGKCRHSIN